MSKQMTPITPERIQELWTQAFSEGETGSSMPYAFAALLFAEQEHPEQMARLGWQYVECPACGAEGARAFPRPEGQPAQRTWVGLKGDELRSILGGDHTQISLALTIETRLKEKKT